MKNNEFITPKSNKKIIETKKCSSSKKLVISIPNVYDPLYVSLKVFVLFKYLIN